MSAESKQMDGTSLLTTYYLLLTTYCVYLLDVLCVRARGEVLAHALVRVRIRVRVRVRVRALVSKQVSSNEY